MEIMKPRMVLLEKKICLGIESTAHTFGVGIVDSKGKVIADKRISFLSDGGIRPQEAAKKHLDNAPKIIKEALDEAKIKISDCDIVSFARGPGLGPCLKVGATCARAIALKNGKPLIPVNHCLAHIEIGKLETKAKDPLIVYVSGGNTQIISFKDGAYRVFGETLDIGLGNMLDSFGRALGYGFPAGPTLDEIYFRGKKYLFLPYTVKGTDLAFAGLETAAKRLVGKTNKENLVFSTLHNAFAMLTEATERALAYTEKTEVLLVGGVAASKALRNIMFKMCISRNTKFLVPQNKFCVDNGVMIAWLGILEYLYGKKTEIGSSQIKQRMRLEEEKILWA
ncbi:MAG: KEOPS complex N(6)-L-threonylcarbamoyladenine synthase Kae1 [Candidatus Diapherotrites archaeon]|nr:KEOPS complex N(6)-L-threonylcarbamoyladenine synthase Kae1 [Candidatus Diapherotrites archaeon]